MPAKKASQSKPSLTGRTTRSEPNIQGISPKTPEAKAIRDAFTGRTQAADPPQSIGPKPVATMPASLISALPVSTQIMQHVRAIEALKPKLEAEMKTARDNGAPSVARAWVVLHKMSELMIEALSISSENGKPFKQVRKQYSEVEIPAVFEQAGVDFMPLAEGFRVGVSNTFRASINDIKVNKDKAYQWLRENGLGDLITATVNASTLSAAARVQVEDHNKEFPEALFKVGYVPSVSVTGTK